MPSSHLSSFSEWQYAFSMLGSNALSSSQCLIAELIGLLNRDFILTFELNGPFGAVGRVATSGRLLPVVKGSNRPIAAHRGRLLTARSSDSKLAAELTFAGTC